jgi:hypothetical protein
VEFREFNNAVTERIVQEICGENNISFEQTSIGKRELELLEIIVDGVSRKTGKKSSRRVGCYEERRI